MRNESPLIEVNIAVVSLLHYLLGFIFPAEVEQIVLSSIDLFQVDNKYNTFTGAQYSPLDMAEYVFWTGDEKGVTLAIEEFLQEGLVSTLFSLGLRIVFSLLPPQMSREQAISFLQEIKYNLDYLKNRYTQLGFNSKDHSKVSGRKIHLANRLETSISSAN